MSEAPRTPPLCNSPQMTREEIVFGWLYLPVFLYLGGRLIATLWLQSSLQYDAAYVQLVASGVDFLVIVLVFRKFLLQSLRETNWILLVVIVPICRTLQLFLALICNPMEVTISNWSIGYVSSAKAATLSYFSQGNLPIIISSVLLVRWWRRF